MAYVARRRQPLRPSATSRTLVTATDRFERQVAQVDHSAAPIYRRWTTARCFS